MAALRNIPYPSSGLDTSIFEDSLDEYDITLNRNDSSLSRKPCHLLRSLIGERKYADAARAKGEMEELGITIEPHAIYQTAAMYALVKAPFKTKEERMAAFISWWSLVPDTSQKHYYYPRTSPIMSALLERTAIPNISLIMQYAIAAAGKGLEGRVSKVIIPIVLRHSPPSISLIFLDKYRKSDLAYRLARIPRRDVRATAACNFQNRKHFRGWYALAIRTHCMAGRYSAAVATLKAARRSNLTIPEATYNFILGYLRRGEHPAVSLVEDIWQEQRTLKPKTPSPPPPLSATRYELPQEIDEPKSPHLITVYSRLLETLAEGGIPAHSRFRHFLALCGMTGEWQLLQNIREKVYIHPRFATVASSMIYAEMLHHSEGGDQDAALMSFAEHCHTIGIPKIALLKIRQLRMEKQNVTEKSLPTPTTLPKPALKHKLWPSSYQSTIVWRIIVQDVLKSDGHVAENLKKLYNELLSQVTLSRAPVSMEAELENIQVGALAQTSHSSSGEGGAEWKIEGSPASIPVQPAPSQYTAAHFNIFIHAFVAADMPRRAANIPADMYRVGIAPTLHGLTTIVKGLASIGNVDRVNALLDIMEASAKPQDESLGSSPGSNMTLPPPTVVTYTAALQGFKRSKCKGAAVGILQRMRTNLDYTPGPDPYLDSAVAWLNEEIANDAN
ncbi:hypothetical protein PHLCEN_2v8360 [Hermanssonia centrifuga]|uniref:Pentatricopeptide repeat-containing protein n=1 Tax=Hermanssonia centrifuga TaxID=98765 RepID=A0A2R6NTZ5_9APHY|nr:hypothetical protein PHLCEN_2v8360 [Hermanssonia centrifuga]